MEIRPILSALLRNKTGPILVALQVALSLAILANALHIVNVRRAAVAPERRGRRRRGVLRQRAQPGKRQPRAAAGHAKARGRRAARRTRAWLGGQRQPDADVALGSNNSVAIDRKQVDETAPRPTIFRATRWSRPGA
jgi:putative ABC transport system permease protein